MRLVMELCSSFLGSFGFSVLYNLKGKKLMASSFGGLITWLVYSAFSVTIKNNFLIYMYTAMIATLYSEFMARRVRTPATIFLFTAIIPMVPGGNLYYTMNYGIAQNWHLFSIYGKRTLMTATAIAGGVMMASSLYGIVMKRMKIKKQNITKNE